MSDANPIAVCLRDAPAMLGVTRHVFEAHVRPHVRTYRIGRRIVIDRGELAAWWEQYKARHDRTATAGKESLCREDDYRASNGARNVDTGDFEKSWTESEFMKLCNSVATSTPKRKRARSR